LPEPGSLSTEDVARSAKFYVEQLGFTRAPQLEGFARVRLGAADAEDIPLD
jgi:hypothetical protein